MTCLLLFGPYRSSIHAFNGRLSDLSITWILRSCGEIGFMYTAPPCTIRDKPKTLRIEKENEE